MSTSPCQGLRIISARLDEDHKVRVLKLGKFIKGRWTTKVTTEDQPSIATMTVGAVKKLEAKRKPVFIFIDGKKGGSYYAIVYCKKIKTGGFVDLDKKPKRTTSITQRDLCAYDHAHTIEVKKLLTQSVGGFALGTALATAAWTYLHTR